MLQTIPLTPPHPPTHPPKKEERVMSCNMQNAENPFIIMLIYTAKPSANWETDRRCCCRSRRSRGKEEKKDQQKAKLRTFRKEKKKEWKRKEKIKKKCSVKSLELFPLPGCLTEAEARVNKLFTGHRNGQSTVCAACCHLRHNKDSLCGPPRHSPSKSSRAALPIPISVCSIFV